MIHLKHKNHCLEEISMPMHLLQNWSQWVRHGNNLGALTGEWVNKIGCLYLQWCISHPGRKETLPIVTVWMGLDGILLSKKDKVRLWFHSDIKSLKKSKQENETKQKTPHIHRSREQIGGCQGQELEVLETWVNVVKKYKFTVIRYMFFK